MPRPKRTTAELEAETLLSELGITELPISVDLILEKLNVRVVYERIGPDVSGMTYRDQGRIIVGLNGAHSPRRQRFTAAHEIGHIRLHPGRPLTIDSSIRVNFRDKVSSEATNSEEIEANAFAAALLMPRMAVIDRARELTSEGIRTREKLIAALSRTFDVSPEAMGYRLINLGVASAP